MAHEATFFTRDCPACCLISGKSFMPQFWDGVYLLSTMIGNGLLQCIRGPRSFQGHYIKSVPVDLIQSETNISLVKL